MVNPFYLVFCITLYYMVIYFPKIDFQSILPEENYQMIYFFSQLKFFGNGNTA